MPSWTSLVPPSIEVALVRSHSRAALPLRERSKGGKAARDWLRTKANSIEGGTSEIQLGIVAKHILRLPGA